ncbi:MAG: 4-hydroxy-tetrahydrodipicolinate reductase [Clostridia bacterium]|nr:4-hydroxy-tetrahydrodipicolinate reductase [Clostridia bacterium]MBR3273518.1 4-hydroxy-tetrahydrodipicolinate reductase [Clostridia bacterium]
MNIIINGAKGRMGRIVDAAAAQAGHSVVARVDFGYGEGEGLRTLEAYQGPADVVIDFSNHAATAQVTEYCVKRNLPVIVATTGQTPEELALIDAAAKAVPVFLSANMSLGVALLADLAKKAAAVFPDADIEIIEKHHNQKLDVPSGTALLLARRIREARPGAEFVIGRHENGKRTKAEIGIHSLRLGNEVGTHEIIIATGSETITLKHEAENRSLFAQGALAAAAFIVGRAPGMYDMRSIIE